MERTCSIDDCPKPVLARELCSSHYQKARRAGFIEPLPTYTVPNRHSLTDIDPATKTATCSICGPTEIRYRIGKSSECMTVRRKTKTPKNPVLAGDRSRRAQLKRYGMTVADFDALFASQGNRCAVCRRKQRDGDRTFHVDHCHSGGGVRGILCGSCNRALGLLRENPTTLRAMVKYVERTRQGTLFWEGATTAADEATEQSA